MANSTKGIGQYTPDSIDNSKSIEEIAAYTNAFNLAAQKAGQKNNDFLANMYGDPSHFIFELLQNAEDSNASKVKMILQEDKFIFIHNGKPFSIDDVIGICKVGNSNKDSSKIGKFGIGFKSVFAVTKNPSIQSGDFNFELIDYNVPRKKGDIDNEINLNKQTKIIIPFDIITKKKHIELITQTLNEIDDDAILFLNSIVMIEIHSSQKSFVIEKQTVENILINETNRVDKIKTSNVDSNKSAFIFSTKVIPIEGINKSIAIAFLFNFDEKSILERKQTKISVYFPTEVNSGLKFKINGPFETSPTRQQLESSSQINLFIWDKLLELYSETLIVLKEKHILNYNFMLQLPLEKDLINKPEIYNLFYEKNLSLFKTSNLLLSQDNQYHYSKEVFFSEEIDEIDFLFSKKELREMFDKEVVFLKIPESKAYKVVETFLENIDVESVDFKKIYNRLEVAILKEKNIQWYLRFYQFASKPGYIKHIQSYPKKILLTSNNILEFPVKVIVQIPLQIKPLLFLPSNSNIKSDYIVNEDLITDLTKEFFYNLGLREISYFELLELDLLPKLNESDKDLSIQTFFRIWNIYSVLLDKEKAKFISHLKDKRIVPVNINGKFSLSKANQTIIKKDSFHVIYKNKDVSFLDNTIQNALFDKNLSIINPDFYEFIQKIGVNDTLIVNEITTTNIYDLDQRILKLVEEKNKPKKINRNGNAFHQVKDYDLPFFNSINIDSKELSFIIWNEISLIPSIYFEAHYNLIFQTPSTNGRSIDKCSSSLINTLNELKWISTEKGFVSPLEITLEEFYMFYDRSISGIEKQLLFKTNPMFGHRDSSLINLNAIASNFNKEEFLELAHKAEEIKRKTQKNSETINDIVKFIEKNSSRLFENLDKESFYELKTVNENNLEFQNWLLKLLDKYDVDKGLFNKESNVKLRYSVIFKKEFIAWKNNNEALWVSSLFNELKDSKFKENKQQFIKKITSYKNYQLDEKIFLEAINSINSLDDYLKIDHKIHFNEKVLKIDVNELYKNNYISLRKRLSVEGLEIMENYLENDDFRSLLHFENEIEYLTDLINSNLKPKSPQRQIKIPKDFKITHTRVDINKASQIKNKPSFAFLGSADQIRKKNENQLYSGKIAEHLVYKFLNDSNVEKLEWVSENAPKHIQSVGLAGFGYDFKYTLNGLVKYIEVKGFKNKASVFKVKFTPNELKFAIENGDDYLLYLCIHLKDEAFIHEISNPFSGINIPEPLYKEGILIETSGYEISFEMKI